ncbi:MAG TPA: hypothetical protein VLI54_04995 [Bacillota bacterium]|nr:hypothetical protein [Bacillota bacterium]
MKSLTEAVVNASIEGRRLRDFLAHKAARRLMEQIGLILPGDDTGNAAVEELLGTVVATGMYLSQRDTIAEVDIQEQTARLKGDLPEPIKVFGALMPHFIDCGIALHRDELVPGTPETTAWIEEFKQLHLMDPHNTLYGE